MTTSSLVGGDPDCPDSVIASTEPSEPRPPLVARRADFGSIDPTLWDSLADSSTWVTPFSRHCVQRAWWDAYGDTAHDQTLVIAPANEPDRVVAIAPLMHRHELEPEDIALKTSIRHASAPGTEVRPGATAVFFGASYHADYATLLAPPEMLAGVADAVVAFLAAQPRDRWDVVDLRRLRCGDPAGDALERAFSARAGADGWALTREREEVCPVLMLPEGADFETYLGTLGKKTRHEIRRKLRRAEAVGPIELVPSPDPLADLEAFVDLHQKRWGEEGLFPDTDGGSASRRFFARLVESCGDLVKLSFLTVGGKRIAAGVVFDDRDSFYYYNAGVDPEARDLSPGVVMVARYIEWAISLGRRRMDFLRGNESYKYDWGAVDEPIQRLLVERIDGAAGRD